ncbi:MAG: homocysteine S-methyltransferase family protein [Lachnospiraceae bacterium]|nr:homocysteine S-methyltransferase family protein [Lachnospiraceae bacterium]
MDLREFKSLTENTRIYLDGATGSELQKRGMPSGVCPDLWISENPEVLIGLQLEYLRAGSRIIYSPTFTANRIKLSEFGLEDRVYELNKTLAGLSRTAIERFREECPDAPPAYVAGDLTMTGKSVGSGGELSFEELIGVYKEQADALSKAGADLMVVETMMSLQETRAAVIACREVTELPVMATLTFEESGRTLYGTDPVTALITLSSLGVSAFGINCSTGPKEMRSMIEELIKYADIPIICKPNAGLPRLDEKGKTVYELDPESFALEMENIAGAGAHILGGCCGTSPAHIRALKAHTEGIPVKKSVSGDNRYLLTGERQTCEFDLNSRFFIIGERINPTGKKDLQAELKEGVFDRVCEYAEEQEEMGSRILDINMGMPGVDEKALMLRAIDEVTGVSNLPLSIDTSHVDIMEAALRLYPGRALINSVSYESAKCEPLLKIARKYGAMCILLPLSDKGIPGSLDEKKDIINKLVEKALSLGLKKNDLVVDGLVGTVGANKEAALDTLKTIRYCREELGIATVCGLSNISFGLPERVYVNSAFLTMAINAGLTMAICNPGQESIRISALTGDLLMGKEGADLSYIEYISLIDKGEEKTKPKEEPEDPVFEAVLKGRRELAPEVVNKALKDGRSADDILNRSLLPAINKVGELFDKKRYFLPQLIASAEAMKKGIDVLEPYLKKDGGSLESAPSIVIGTVEGDIHDIGKNLVVMMLKNHGFVVTDLGKDVSKEAFLKAAREKNADIVAMSALMTTTMKQMKATIEHLKANGYDGRFMIGGAVITEGYAEEIGAFYSRDAADAVKVAKNIMEK